MPDWIIAFLSGVQRSLVATFATELRAGGLTTAYFAFFLGAVHALTPGHGKAALVAYFFGQQARIGTGVRVALSAAFLHVLMGFTVFLVLRFLVQQMPAMTGRGSPLFAVSGYALIGLAGAVMIAQSMRLSRPGAGAPVLTVGIGLLPCPLTISVLGFAWAQGPGPITAAALLALAGGIAFTIGTVAVLAIFGRRALGPVLLARVPSLERGARILQAVAGVLIVALAAYAIWPNV
jgi:ABC-type nickel/cobalt efflux system permease component RcnA